MNCPLHRDTPDTSRYNPSCARSASCFALHDQVLILFALANIVTDTADESWQKGLDVLEVQIKAMREAKGRK